MRSVRSLIHWAGLALQRQGIGKVLAHRVLTRARSGLGGSHTVVTYPPLDVLGPSDAEQVLATVRPVDRVDLYMHVPFCEYLCGYCHYDTVGLRIDGEDARVAGYFGALHLELGSWKDRWLGSRLSSLYIGGGTPTVVRLERLLALLEAIEEVPRAAGFMACVETSPLTVCAPGGESKLAALAAAGITRVSIGIQSFKSSLLEPARHYDGGTARSALARVMQLGVTVNADFMQDLPGQTDEDIVEDVCEIARFRPQQVTWYITRLRGESAWGRRFERSELELAHAVDSLRRRLLIRAAMEEIGYRACPGGRFVRVDGLVDSYKEVRAGLDATLVGTGVSSYSHGWGYMFRNAASGPDRPWGEDYAKRLRGSGSAIRFAYQLDAIELAASKLVSGIRSKTKLPAPTPMTEAYLEQARRTLDMLADYGLVSSPAPGEYGLTGNGALFEEEICSLFYSPAVKRRLAERGAYWVTGSQGAASFETLAAAACSSTNDA